MCKDVTKLPRLQLSAVVCYYGKHYSTFVYDTKSSIWKYFDDATVMEVSIIGIIKKKDWTCIVRIMHKKCVPLQFHLCKILCDRKPFPCLNLNYSSAIIYNSTLIIEKGPFLFPIIKWYLNMNLIKCTTIDQVKKYPNHAYLIWWYHYIRGKRVTLIQYGQVVNKNMK